MRSRLRSLLRWWRRAVAALAVIVLAAILLAMFHFAQGEAEDDAHVKNLEETVTDLTREVEDQKAVAAVLADQLEDLGEKPRVEPSVSPSLPVAAPTFAQGMLWITTFCEAHDDCKGDTGDEGAAGTDGVSPPPAKDGKDGTDGKDGRGIASGPTCMPDGTWQTTYTDGTTSTQPGPCRVRLVPRS